MKKIETITFHEPKSNITFTIKKSFLKKCPNYKRCSTITLVDKFEIFNYFHNETGHAVIDHKTKPKLKSYFLNGNSLDSKKEWKKQLKKLGR